MFCCLPLTDWMPDDLLAFPTETAENMWFHTPPPPVSNKHFRSDRIFEGPNYLGTELITKFQNRGFRLKDWGMRSCCAVPCSNGAMLLRTPCT